MTCQAARASYENSELAGKRKTLRHTQWVRIWFSCVALERDSQCLRILQHELTEA